MQSDSALRRPAVVICPGGAYEFCSVREADAPALRLDAHALALDQPGLLRR